jgi:hypothetical protein
MESFFGVSAMSPPVVLSSFKPVRHFNTKDAKEHEENQARYR